MSYIITTNLAGQIGVNPRLVRVLSTDNLSTVTSAGYLPATGVNALLPTDEVHMIYGMSSINPPSNDGTLEIFTVSISGEQATLVQWANPGDVLLPVTSGDFATFNGTTGQIKDAGYLPSNAAKTKVVMANGAVTVGNIACYTDTSGTVGQNATTAINNGGIQAGVNGTPGGFTSYPNTSNAGNFQFYASATSGNHFIGFTNAAIAQATTFTVPDPGVNSSNVAVTSAALVNGNLVKASGTNGVIVDAGFSVLAKTTSAYAGGGTSNAFTATGLTSSSIVTASILTSTNSVSITKAVPSSNTLTITFSADPGANTTVNYHAITPAV